jgi:hypothetical protein
MSYVGLGFPDMASVDAYYYYAALMTIKEDWPSITAWEATSMRQYKASMHRWIVSWRHPQHTEEEKRDLESRQQVFNACCDIVDQGRSEAEMHGELDFEAWKDEQMEKWARAQTYVNDVFVKPYTGGSKTPLHVINLWDEVRTVALTLCKTREANFNVLSAVSQR